MELVIKNRNGRVSEQQRTYVAEKLSKLERHMDQISKATVEVSEEQRRNQGTVHRAQVTLIGTGGVLLRADQYAPDLHTAIDLVQETLQRQIQRYKDKHWRRGRPRRAPEHPAVLNGTQETSAADVDTDEQAPQIVRTKQFSVKPMHSDEALEQMELLGHDFFIFRDAESSQISVLYRRKDGNYGMISAEETSR